MKVAAPFMGSDADAYRRGFTVLEVAVALVAGAILLWGLTRFYKDSSRTFITQTQVADRDQNAHFTIRLLTEALQQSGASLPDTGYPVISVSGGLPASSITVATNPRGGVYYISSAAPSTLTKIPVGDTSLFTDATDILIDYLNPARATVKRPIASKKKGSSSAELDTIILSSGVPYQLDIGDVVYAYKEEIYSLSGSNLVVDGNVMAENIDSLKFYFYDGARNATSNWTDMRSAKLQVTARTPRPDPKLPGDGYRKITLTMDVFLRSRI